MSYREFRTGDVSPCSFILGQAFHRSRKPPFSWFARVLAWAQTIAHALCQGLQGKNYVMCCQKQSPRGVLWKGVLRSFMKFTGKHLCQSLFFNKVAGLRPTLLKKRLWHRCFPVNFVAFLRTPFFTENLWWLLLYCVYKQHKCNNTTY